MTNTVLRHDAHDIADLVVWNADTEVFGHDLLYKGSFYLLTAGRAFTQNISLCDDADHLSLVVDDDERSNMMGDHSLHGCMNGGVWLNGDNGCFLGAKDVFDLHGCLTSGRTVSAAYPYRLTSCITR